MATQKVTSNLSLALPGDDSHNTPWGSNEKIITDAIASIDAQVVAGVQQGSWKYAADTGTANAYAVALTPAPTLAAGLDLFFKAVHANTGASTLAVNGDAAKAITKTGANALVGAEINAGQVIHVVYDGTQFQLVSQ